MSVFFLESIHDIYTSIRYMELYVISVDAQSNVAYYEYYVSVLVTLFDESIY